jgi:hypothetical protein
MNDRDEPVAWADIDREGHDFWVSRQCPAKDGVPLYIAPLSIEAAIKAEREACAKICETIYQNDDITQDWLEDAAKAIRARGEK